MSIVWTDTVTPLNAANMNALEQIARKGAANGYASLDSGGKVPLAQTPLSPVTNGQWLKGVGGAPVWSAIAAADLPPQAVPGYGTTLPGSPTDGQEYILVDSITNPTYEWRLRYNAGSSSAYKWEYVGGLPARFNWLGAPTVISTLTQIATTGWYFPNVAYPQGFFYPTPRAGEWVISGQCIFDANGTLTYAMVTPMTGGNTVPLSYPRGQGHFANIAWFLNVPLVEMAIGAVAAGVVIGVAVTTAVPTTTRLVHLSGNVYPLRLS